ncbi:MAG TPA: hypothetical protein PL110_07500 [Candidatus Eremiobacteraeota bacterium]|nr:hypothetical protein [Candidatus Eremiobacteraeota bacterium]
MRKSPERDRLIRWILTCLWRYLERSAYHWRKFLFISPPAVGTERESVKSLNNEKIDLLQ